MIFLSPGMKIQNYRKKVLITTSSVGSQGNMIATGSTTYAHTSQAACQTLCQKTDGCYRWHWGALPGCTKTPKPTDWCRVIIILMWIGNLHLKITMKWRYDNVDFWRSLPRPP